MSRMFIVGMLAVTLYALPAGALPEGESAALDMLPGADVPVELQYKKTPLSKIMDALASIGSFEVSIEGSAGETIVTLRLEKQSLKEVLVHLAAEYHLAYEVPAEGQLVVRDRDNTK